MSRFRRGAVSVERIGSALWLEADGTGLLVGAPADVARTLGDRAARLRSVLLLDGAIERVCGLPALFAGRSVPLVLRFPLSDERGALFAEAWQRGWGDFDLTLDAVAPGSPMELGPARATTQALREPHGGPPPMGVRITWDAAVVAILPPCLADAAARRLCRGAHLVVASVGGGGLSAGQAVELAGEAELWLDGDGPYSA